jgi:hypothetical protein
MQKTFVALKHLRPDLRLYAMDGRTPVVFRFIPGRICPICDISL